MSQRPATILIVDDHAPSRQLVVELCKHMGHKFFEASDGAEALVIAHSKQPQLVICDILMPTMDGYEFVRQLRSDPKIAETEVIFYTANYREREARNLADAVGVSHIITKPCEPADIMHAIDAGLARTAKPLISSHTEEFDQEHLRVMTDKLAEKADELQQTNQQLSALIDLNLQLASARDPQTLLESVCRGARELLGARFAFLCVKGKGNNSDHHLFSSGLPPRKAEKLKCPQLENSIFGQVVAGGKSLRFQNPAGKPLAIGLPSNYPDILHGLVVPVVSLHSVYGWLCLANKVGAEEFSEEDERVLTIHAAQVGRIYENGSLYAQVENRNALLKVEIEERKLSEHKIRGLNRVYAVLSQINSLIVRVASQQELFQEATRIATEAGQFPKAWIGLIQPDEAHINITALSGDADSFFEKLQAALYADETFTRFISPLLAKKPLIINDLENDTWVPLRDKSLISGSRSLVWLPLIAGDRVVGVLSLHANTPNFFDANEMELLLELAGDIGFAIKHLENSDKLYYTSHFDTLTGLANTKLFLERLAHCTDVNEGRKYVGLALLDIERFKMVNDALGRHAGDSLLVQVAKRLVLSTGNSDYVARLSADQFAVIIPALTDESDIAHSLEKLRHDCFDFEFQIDDIDLRKMGKIGVAIYPSDGANADSLFKNAEVALKKAKATGEPYLFYSAEMNDRVLEKMTLENKLRQALQRDEFVMHYQSKVSSLTREIVGVEALIRWNAPQTGLVSPAEFIPLLEETGLILEVGAWALNQAVRDYGRWVALGLNPPRIAVNVSAKQLHQNDFVETVKQILTSGMLAPGIDIEITESMLMEDIEGNIIKLSAIREMGINVAIDDFGTGYSSLAYLARLPIQAVKIDRSFIITMLENPINMTLVSTVITLAHSLGMKVIAEGVDQEEQEKILALLRCDELQGYLFSKPLPFDKMTAHLH